MSPKHTPSRFLAVVLWLAATCLVCYGTSGPTEPAPTDFLLPKQLRPVHRVAKVLDPHLAVVRSPEWALHDVPVQVVRTDYDGKWIRAQAGKAQEIVGRPTCFELIPVGEPGTDPYEWAMWSLEVPYRPRWFWLFRVGGRATYLVFSSGVGLNLADVTEPRNPTVAFQEDMGVGPSLAYEEVPLLSLKNKWAEMGGRLSFGFDAPQVQPTSLSPDSEGNLVLSVTGTNKNLQGRLVRKEGKWDLLDVRGAPSPGLGSGGARAGEASTP